MKKSPFLKLFIVLPFIIPQVFAYSLTSSGSGTPYPSSTIYPTYAPTNITAQTPYPSYPYSHSSTYSSPLPSKYPAPLLTLYPSYQSNQNGKPPFPLPSGNPTKLEGNNLSRCILLQKEIIIRSEKSMEEIGSTSAKLTSILQGVQNYYKNVLLPNNIVVANFDGLVSKATTAQTNVTQSLLTAQKDITSFSCQGESFAKLHVFKNDMQKTLQALKEYQQALKNLFMAIKAVAIDSKDISTKPATASAK